MEKERPFSSFGSALPRSNRSPVRKFFTYVGAFILFAVVPLAFVGWRELWVNLLERDRPEIILEKPPVGLGLEPLRFSFDVTDSGSGIDEVIVRGVQGSEVREIFRRDYDGPKVNRDTINIEMSKDDHPFDEGDLTITIVTFDRAFFPNVRQVSIEVEVDYGPPEIEVITTQHNAVLGGSQMVFYRLKEVNDVFSGITVGQYLFPGFPAKALDEDYESRPDVYFAFFPIPLNFVQDKDKIRLFARDRVGNFTSAPIHYRVRDPNYPERPIALKTEFLEGTVYELAKKYSEFDAKMNLKQEEEVAQPNSPEEMVKQFISVNEGYRNLLETSMKEIFGRPKIRKLWDGSFVRLPDSREVAQFGEKRRYFYQGLDAGSVVSSGVDLLMGRGAKATAVNDGIVVYSGEMGPFGKTVIIDHGFGLYSLYGFLSSSDVSEGDKVLKSEAIGSPGSTGLNDLVNSVHFEMRLHGLPVRPVEWWDSQWVRDHITNRIQDTKKILGMRTRLPLEKRGL